jgi:hypothetical protein
VNLHIETHLDTCILEKIITQSPYNSERRGVATLNEVIFGMLDKKMVRNLYYYSVAVQIWIYHIVHRFPPKHPLRDYNR